MCEEKYRESRVNLRRSSSARTLRDIATACGVGLFVGLATDGLSIPEFAKPMRKYVVPLAVAASMATYADIRREEN